jgi:hypothetical protein
MVLTINKFFFAIAPAWVPFRITPGGGLSGIGTGFHDDNIQNYTNYMNIPSSQTYR